ncbi:DNA binding protein motif protein [Ranid herpesvirus 3]|uniref:DNA binding protein motif protein n=1 Tax=Ranid herpesvirus 3 TaxID=1987509 RepID=A0A1X9T5F5_9VIRU|nr:DNA binding protein motif protein [Ranid herpesvirus 3]ARR28931.1 DNA binding protein motif protein [Ranid herpesvirus 3]
MAKVRTGDAFIRCYLQTEVIKRVRMTWVLIALVCAIPCCVATSNYTSARVSGAVTLWSTASFAYYKTNGSPGPFLLHFASYCVPVSVIWKWLYLVKEIELGMAQCVNTTHRWDIQRLLANYTPTSCERHRIARIVNPVYFVTPLYALGSVLDESISFIRYMYQYFLAFSTFYVIVQSLK